MEMLKKLTVILDLLISADLTICKWTIITEEAVVTYYAVLNGRPEKIR